MSETENVPVEFVSGAVLGKIAEEKEANSSFTSPRLWRQFITPSCSKGKGVRRGKESMSLLSVHESVSESPSQ